VGRPAKVLDLANRENAVIKVSGACTLSANRIRSGHLESARLRVDAWVSTLPVGQRTGHAHTPSSIRAGHRAFLKTDRLSDSERAMLMGGACAKAIVGRQSVSSRRFQTMSAFREAADNQFFGFIAFLPPLALPASALALHTSTAGLISKCAGTISAHSLRI